MREPSISFDRIAESYDDTRTFPGGVADRIVSAMGGFVPRGDAILDVGVGTGRVAAPLRGGGYEVVGVDVSREMMVRARRKGVEDLLLADARLLPFANGAFGCTVSVHVTHLIRDWRAVLAEIGRVTRKWYVSVATDREGCEVEAVQEAYERACARLGHEVRHPGLREKELASLIRPSAVTALGECDENVSAEEVLERYRSRTYSDLWDVPESTHAEAMSTLQKEFGVYDRLRRREKVSLVVWEADEVRAFAADAIRGGEGD